jgi:hypothetical protein
VTWVNLSYVSRWFWDQEIPDPEAIWESASRCARHSFGRADYLRLTKDGMIALIGLEHPEVADMIAIGEKELLALIVNCKVLVLDASGSLWTTEEVRKEPIKQKSFYHGERTQI